MNVLAIDSNTNNLEIIKNQVKKDHNQFFGTTEITQAISYLTNNDIDVTIVNKFLSNGDSSEIIRSALSQTPPSPVVIISHLNTLDAMMESLQLGATDYISDPIDTKVLEIGIHRAYERRQIYLSTHHVDALPKEETPFDFLQGSSNTMQLVFDQIRQGAPYKTTVLITGESGTGKDLVARSLHALSNRSHKPFLSINCSAIPRDLVESQLFGHEKGAFTSAEAKHEGIFEAANGGTLFLDEIGDLALEAQAKLLRVLENRQITRLGSTTPIDVDVRLIAATNSNFEQAITEGKFRSDLFYRLNVLHVQMPPLRERQTDIPLLIRLFLDRFAQENEKIPKQITEEALAKLTAHQWPGNIRELKNIAERLAVNTLDETIDVHHLPSEFQNLTLKPEISQSLDLTPFIGIPLAEIEKMLIARTLDDTNGNRTHAARLLGVSIRTLQRKLKASGQENLLD